MSSRIELVARSSAFSKRLESFAVINHEHIDIQEFLADAFHYFKSKVSEVIENLQLIKVSTCFVAEFEKVVHVNDVETKEMQTIYIHSKNHIVDQDTDLAEDFEESVVNHVLKKVDDVMLQGSSFVLSHINELMINLSRFDPISGSSYINLPKFLSDKKAIINVQNKDQQCFKWAVLSAIYQPKSNSSMQSSYAQYHSKLNFKGLSFPIKLNDINKFEQINQSISINVYFFEPNDKKIRPLRLTKEQKTQHIHLLLLSNCLESSLNFVNPFVNYHYCWIKNLSRLITSQVTKNGHKHFFCDRCLNHFTSSVKLEKHRIHCINQNDCEIKMPPDGKNKLKFKNFKNQLEVPFMIYADIETLLQPPKDSFCRSESTTAYHQHQVYSIGFYFKCMFDDTKSVYKSRRSPT